MDRDAATWEIVNETTGNTLASFATQEEAETGRRSLYRVGCDDDLAVIGFDVNGEAVCRV